MNTQADKVEELRAVRRARAEQAERRIMRQRYVVAAGAVATVATGVGLPLIVPATGPYLAAGCVAVIAGGIAGIARDGK